MNILIISTQNPFRTSGIVAYNLYNCLKDENTNVKVLIKPYTLFEYSDFICVDTPLDVFKEKWKGKFERLFSKFGVVSKLNKTIHDFHVQDYDQTKQIYSTKRILKKVDFKPDVIFYLFQQNFLTARNLYELNMKTGAKIIWYMMDTAPLTGLCHYSWDCRGYITGCGCCPALNSNDKNDQSNKNLMFKNKYLNKTDIEVIVASEYQKKIAANSFLFKNKPLHKVLLSIDSSVFSFKQKAEAKQSRGIDPQKKVIFCGGTSIHDRRKGMSYLMEALMFLSKNTSFDPKKIILLVAGNSNSLFKELPFEVKYIGFLENNGQLAAVYQSSDVFVCPSIEDAGPMMINQAIMTGTPVVSFEMGVGLDLVITKKTGYRAVLRDSRDLAKGIEYILTLDSEKYLEISKACRNLAEANYSHSEASKRIKAIINKQKV